MTENAPTPHNEAVEIAIRLRGVGQLFNSFDPSPFFEKDLDSNAEDFIYDWARELPASAPFRIAVHLPPQEAARPEAAEIPEALHHFFKERARMADRGLRELFRVGRRALMVGLGVLIVCLLISQIAPTLISNPTIARIVEESFIIVGWVANWRPIEIYLYEWWPIRRRAKLYRRIAEAPVTVKAD